MIRILILIALIVTLISGLWSESHSGRMDACMRRHDDLAYCETAGD